jgi:hypothetical protein
VRRQIVAQCRGAASLDIRDRTLQAVLVPLELIDSSTSKQLSAAMARIRDLRQQLADETQRLSETIEKPFGASGVDYRPTGWSQL